MDKDYVSSILETIKKNLDSSASQKHFSLLSHEFYELFNNHYAMVKNLDVLEKSLKDANLSTALEGIKSSLKDNLDHIVQIMGQLTDREFIIYEIASGDTLWKIVKKFNSKIDEICELNNINNVFRLEEGKVLLIPIAKQK